MNLTPMKIVVSNLHDQKNLSSFFKHFHFVHLQGFKIHSFKQQPFWVSIILVSYIIMIMKSTRGFYNEMACGLGECECVNGCA
jgi:hypothetical protein